MNYTFSILRYDPQDSGQSRVDTFSLAIQDDWTILDCLHKIRAHHDATLSFRRSCTNGICGSCAMNINGVNRLACEVMVSSLKKKRVTLKPLLGFTVIKDLVVDLDPFFSGIEEIVQRIESLDKRSFPQERKQSPKEREKLDGLYECISCGACTSACPTFWKNSTFIGPAALLRALRFVEDSRNQSKDSLINHVNGDRGPWECQAIFNCVEACPKGLNPAKAIQALIHRIFKGNLA